MVLRAGFFNFYIQSMDAIRLDKVSFRYPGTSKWALSEVSLSIPQGSFFAMLGPNGAGKTTLLRLLCGRFASFAGQLNIADEFRGEKGFLNPENYGVLLENPGIYPKLSIQEYLDYFAGFYGLGEAGSSKEKQSHERMAYLANKLEMPSLSVKLSSLSLGNRQKVQILRAMVHNPKLLILDEPVANLDPISRESVWSMISDWRKEDGGTAIVCSHILAEMEAEATDFAIINDGKVISSGAVKSKSDECDFAGAMNLKFNGSVSVEQVRAALAAAGIPLSSIDVAKNGLSELYQKSVRNS